MEIVLIYIAMLLLPIIATIRVKSAYRKFTKVRNTSGMTGCEVAHKILSENGLDNVYVVETNRGEMSDHYDPTRKTVRLSPEVFNTDSISAMAIAAHECGHAIQDKEGYSWMRFRSSIYPIVSFGSNIAYYVLLAGIIFQLLDLIYIAIALTCLGLLFQIVTLPVEFDASKRAKKILYDDGLVDKKEQNGVDKVLNSAAFTYVAGVLSSALDVLYLILRYTERRD